MKKLGLTWDADLTREELEAVVASVAAEFGLTIGLCTALKTVLGSQHWHLKQGSEAGVLEITLVAGKKQGEVSVHANRNAPWIAEEIGPIHQRLQALLLTPPG